MGALAGRVLKVATGCRLIQGFQNRKRIEFGCGEGVADKPLACSAFFSVSE